MKQDEAARKAAAEEAARAAEVEEARLPDAQQAESASSTPVQSRTPGSFPAVESHSRGGLPFVPWQVVVHVLQYSFAGHSLQPINMKLPDSQITTTIICWDVYVTGSGEWMAMMQGNFGTPDSPRDWSNVAAQSNRPCADQRPPGTNSGTPAAARVLADARRSSRSGRNAFCLAPGRWGGQRRPGKILPGAVWPG